MTFPYRVPPVPRRLRVPLFVLVLTALGVVATFTSAPESARPYPVVVATAGALVGLVVSLSLVGYHRLRPRLGSLTSVAALAVLWALAWAGFVLLSPQCPGSVSPGRCGAADVGGYLMLGVLLPVAIASLLLPPVLFGRVARNLVLSVLAVLRPAPTPPPPPAADRSARRSGNPARRAAARTAERPPASRD